MKYCFCKYSELKLLNGSATSGELLRARSSSSMLIPLALNAVSMLWTSLFLVMSMLVEIFPSRLFSDD